MLLNMQTMHARVLLLWPYSQQLGSPCSALAYLRTPGRGGMHDRRTLRSAGLAEGSPTLYGACWYQLPLPQLERAVGWELVITGLVTAGTR